MSEANKELAKRWFEEVWNKKRREAIAEMLASDAVIYEAGEAIHGPEGFYPFFDRMQATFSEMNVTFQDAISEEDKVCLRWSVSVRHSGGGRYCSHEQSSDDNRNHPGSDSRWQAR